MSGHVKTFKVQDKNNKSMVFRINDENLLEKYKAIWSNIEDLYNTELNSLPVYDDRYMKIKIVNYDDKVYTNFCSLNVREDDLKCGPFTVISFEFLHVYKFTCK